MKHTPSVDEEFFVGELKRFGTLTSSSCTLMKRHNSETLLRGRRSKRTEKSTLTPTQYSRKFKVAFKRLEGLGKKTSKKVNGTPLFFYGEMEEWRYGFFFYLKPTSMQKDF